MFDRDQERIACFLEYRGFKSEGGHGCDCRFNALSYIAIWWMRELVEYSLNCTIAGCALSRESPNCHVGGEATGALNFNAIIENSNVNIVSDAIVPMDNSVSDDFMERLRGILDVFEFRTSPHFRNLLNKLSGERYGSGNLFV